MIFPTSLNRRHKAVLFLALIAVGIGLLWGAGVKQSLGIALLGMAFAWAFGSDSRPVHWLFVIAGALVAVAPLAYQWQDQQGAARSYQSKVAAFERDIPKLAKQYPILDPHDIAKVPSGIKLTQEDLLHQWKLHSAMGALSREDQQKYIEDFLKKYPAWKTVLVDSSERESERAQFILFDKAIDGGLNWAAMPYYDLPGDPPEPYRLWRAIVERWPIELPGLLALCVGLGLVVCVRPARTK